MKNLPFKKTALLTDHKKRVAFLDHEIFSNTSFILSQAKFAKRLNYLFQKQGQKGSYYTTLKNRCILSGYSRSVLSRIKFSRVALSKKVLDGSLTGFYRAI